MSTYGKLITCDGEATMILLEMTGKERDEFFPDWRRIDELENLIFAAKREVIIKKSENRHSPSSDTR